MSNSQTAPGTPATGSSSNVVGVHYKVGKKIGEGSFGVIFEGEWQEEHWAERRIDSRPVARS